MSLNLENLDFSNPPPKRELSPRSRQALDSQGLKTRDLRQLTEDDIIQKFPELRDHRELVPAVMASYEVGDQSACVWPARVELTCCVVEYFVCSIEERSRM